MKFITEILHKRTYESFILLSLRIKRFVARKRNRTDVSEETPAFIFWLEAGGSVLRRHMIHFIYIYIYRFYARYILCETKITNVKTCENLRVSAIKVTKGGSILQWHIFI